MSNSVTFLLLLFLFVNCKNKEQQTNTLLSNTIKEEVVIKITTEFVRDDRLQLFYTENPLENFSEKLSLYQSVSGKKGFQEVIFELPKDTHPEKIRIDLGNNRAQELISIEKIVITKKNAQIVIDSNNFKDYFDLSNTIKFSIGTMSFKMIQTEGSYDPFLICTPLLIKELINL